MANTTTPRSNNFNGWFYDAVTPAMKFYNRGTLVMTVATAAVTNAGAVTTTGNHTFSSTTALGSGAVAYTWPSGDGTNTHDLNTNGSGTLSWAA
jgi:hypothetical protein